MRITSKFDGTCSLCGGAWSAGDEIEYRKGCSPICTACAAAGRVPPEKEGAPAAKLASGPKSQAPATTPAPPAEWNATVLADAMRPIERLLAQILAELREARPPRQASSTPPSNPPESMSEAPF